MRELKVTDIGLQTFLAYIAAQDLDTPLPACGHWLRAALGRELVWRSDCGRKLGLTAKGDAFMRAARGGFT